MNINESSFVVLKIFMNLCSSLPTAKFNPFAHCYQVQNKSEFVEIDNIFKTYEQQKKLFSMKYTRVKMNMRFIFYKIPLSLFLKHCTLSPR